MLMPCRISDGPPSEEDMLDTEAQRYKHEVFKEQMADDMRDEQMYQDFLIEEMRLEYEQQCMDNDEVPYI